VKEGGEILDQWILYLEKETSKRHLINAIEDCEQLNAVHMAAKRSDAKTLIKFLKFGAGRHDILHVTNCVRDKHWVILLDLDCCTEDDAENPPLVLATYHVPRQLYSAGEEALRRNEAPDGRIEIVIEDSFRALLEYCKDIDVNKQNHFGTTALHVACKRGSTGMVKLLLKKNNTDVKICDNLNNTPLHIACAHGNSQMCKALIDSDVGNQCFKRKNNDGMMPLHVAALASNKKVVQMILLEFSKDMIEEKDNNGHTPFLLAVKSGDVEAVEIFIDNGADITVKNKNDANALHLAAMANHKKVLEKLRS